MNEFTIKRNGRTIELTLDEVAQIHDQYRLQMLKEDVSTELGKLARNFIPSSDRMDIDTVDTIEMILFEAYGQELIDRFVDDLDCFDWRGGLSYLVSEYSEKCEKFVDNFRKGWKNV